MPPVHDYVISNASGSSVRQDINNALAAIVSNNSNDTSPATTYPYQWWADTTTGQLKLRASDNLSWITIFELDGTMLMEDGSLAAPGLAFASDLDTGFSRSASNKINFSTGGAERLEIGDSEVVFNDPSNDVDFRVESNGNSHMLFVDAGNDRVGIGTSAPGDTFEVKAGFPVIAMVDSDTTNDKFRIVHNGGSTQLQVDPNNVSSSSHLLVSVDGSERARIDSSGRLLVAASSARENYFSSASGQSLQFQIEGTDYKNSAASFTSNSTSAGHGPHLAFGRSRGTSVGSNTIVNDGDTAGVIVFHGNDGSKFVQAARIDAAIDGTPGSDDMPGRLLFSTTADGANNPTERVRIDSSGHVGIGHDSPASLLTVGGDAITTAKPTVSIAPSSGNGSLTLRGGSATLSFDITGSNDGTIIYDNSSDLLFKNGTLDSSSEVARFDDSGRLLIGTTTEGAANADNLTIADSGHAGITVRSGTSSKGAVYFSDGTSGAAEYQGVVEYDHSSNALVLFSNAAEGLRVDSSQRVGIGTSSPAAKLQVKVGTDQNFAATSTSGVTQLQAINDAASAFEPLDIAGSDIRLSPGSSEAARIDSTGRVFIGSSSITTVGSLFAVQKNGNDVVGFVNTSGTAGQTIATLKGGPNVSDSTTKFFSFQRDDGVERGSIKASSTGSVTYNTSSDYRLKENVVDISDSIIRFKQLQPRRFNFIEDPDTTVDGFIAHEAQTVVPEAVSGTHNEVDADGNPVYQGIDQSKLVPLLTAALQEAIVKIETLETKVAALEAG